MMRVPLGMSRRAKQPLPCTFERRTMIHLFAGARAFALVFFFAVAMIRLPPWRLDGRVMLVIHELEILRLILEKAGRPTRDLQLRQRQGRRATAAGQPAPGD